MTPIKLFGELSKAEKQDDGTLIVSGVASSEAVDSAGETIKAEAIKAAIPDYMTFGAVREMHQPHAAGVALKCEVKADGKTHIEARIVDPVTIKKVETGVLKGFSVGGKVTERDTVNKTVITGIKLTEISLVDRPCNPEALVSLCKVDDDEDDKKDKKDKPEADAATLQAADAATLQAGDEAKDDKEDDKEDDKDEKDGKGKKKDKDDDAEKLAKLATEHTDALAKIQTLETQLAKVTKELDELKAMPAPPKGAAKAVAKGDDVNTDNDADAELRKVADGFSALPPLQQAAALVKLIHTSGRR